MNRLLIAAFPISLLLATALACAWIEWRILPAHVSIVPLQGGFAVINPHRGSALLCYARAPLPGAVGSSLDCRDHDFP